MQEMITVEEALVPSIPVFILPNRANKGIHHIKYFNVVKAPYLTDRSYKNPMTASRVEGTKNWPLGFS